MICDRCNGKGHIHTFLDGKDHKPITCPKCRGKEDIDWIENIFGVSPGKKIKPGVGVYIKEVDLSYHIPSYITEDKDFKIEDWILK